MNKFITTAVIAGIVSLGVLSSEAHATTYCNGTTTESSFTPYGVTAGGTLPNGHTYTSADWQEYAIGMDNGTTDTGANAGMFIRGNHRSCGLIKGYLYTGAHPQNWAWGQIRLNPAIVSASVNEAGCNVSLGKVSAAYSTDEGYDAYDWPFTSTVFTDGSAGNGHEMVVNWLALTNGDNLEPFAVYLIVFSCTTNVPS